MQGHNKGNTMNNDIITQVQEYGARYEKIDGEWVTTHVFPVPWDWDGYRFHGYARATPEEVAAAGYIRSNT